jgi:branched-chain amino acid transport system substrate-binding protein
MPVRVLLLACLSLSAIGSGCKPSGGASADIPVGHYASLTGSEATFGQSTDNGFMLAIEEFNAAGGLDGKKVRPITLDDKGIASEAGTAVTRLVTSDRVVCVIGEVASGLSLAGAAVCQEMGVPMISPSSTNTQVTQKGDMISRVCFLDPFQAWACAKFLRNHEGLNAMKVAILFDQKSPYSEQLAAEFEKSFVSMGGKIVRKDAFTSGDQDFSAQLTAIRGSGPDAIFVPCYYTDAGNIAVQARKLGITVPLMGGDGWDSVKLAEIGGSAIEGCFYSNHYSHEDPNPTIQQFVQKYKDKYGKTPDALAALGYDAARVFLKALTDTKSEDPKVLARAIAATKDFDGVTGKITLDANRDPVKPATIIVMKNGQPSMVTTIAPEK